MSNSTVQILARVLRVLLIFALLLNVLALLLVPASVMVNAENLFGGAGTFLHDLFHPEADDVTAAGVSAIFLSWVWIWGEGANALIALFLVICGICTALILLQGLRVLGTILQGAPFSTQNAVSLRRAAVCSFCIAGAALLRTIWGLWFYQSLRPLATYNALFVPIFTMFGLLCLVMSALFRQATEMKAENDLTILEEAHAMVRTAAQKIADVLIFLCGFLIFCDILLLPLTPALAYFRFQNPASMRFDHLLAVFAYDFDDGVGNLLEIILKESWKSPETAVLALFLLLAGICGAVILVQGIRLLASVADGTPFSPKNAVYLQRAAAGCFVIAAGALGRTAFTLCRDGAAALLSYTALFIPLFTMAGLLCLVMAGLFHRAAEMKAENDLTI